MIEFFDEMLSNESTNASAGMREPYADYGRWFEGEDPGRIHPKAAQAEAFFRNTGIHVRHADQCGC